MKKQFRATEQKVALYEYLKKARSHPTAEEIYNVLKPSYRQLSLATVYRGLESLQKQNAVLEILDLNGKAHFDGFVHNHDHFFCEKCKKIYDFNEKSILKNLQDIPCARRGFKINSYQLIFSGKCHICRKKERR
ncbi:MAG: transcriptional repressor [Patescibacteria group bacterium]